MEQDKDKILTSSLKKLITDSINSAKKEVNNEKDNIILSKEAVNILKNDNKTTTISTVIQTIIAALVIFLSIGGSWYNSKIEMHEFYNELKYLKIKVEIIEMEYKKHVIDNRKWEIEYTLLKQKVNDIYNDINKNNKSKLP